MAEKVKDEIPEFDEFLVENYDKVRIEITLGETCFIDYFAHDEELVDQEEQKTRL